MTEDIDNNKKFSDRHLSLVVLAVVIFLVYVPNFIIREIYIKNYQSTDDFMAFFVLPMILLMLAVILPILVVKIIPKYGILDFKWFRWTRGEFLKFWLLPFGVLASVMIVRFLVNKLRMPSVAPGVRFITGSSLCYYMPLYVWLIMRTCVLSPVVEEFFWRGYVQSTLLKISRPVFAVFGQAVLFGLVHFQPVLGFLRVSLLGLVFGIWCYRRKTLLPVIIIHIAINSFIFINEWYDRREINKVKITKNYVTEFIELSKPDVYDPNNDAREQYSKATRLMIKIPNKLEEIRNHYPSQWSSEELTMAETWLLSNTQPLNLIEKGTQKPYYWVKYRRRNNLLYDRMPVLTPDFFNKMKDVIFALCIRATLRAYQGQIEQSFSDIVTCGKLGDHLIANKDSTPKLYGWACYGNVMQTMRMILANKDLNSKLLENLQNQFEIFTGQENFKFDITGKRFLLFDAIQCMFTDDGQSGGHIPRYYFKSYIRDGKYEYVNAILSLADASEIKNWKKLQRSETTAQVERYCELLDRVFSCSPWRYDRNYQGLKTSFEQIKKENPLIKTFSFNPQLLFMPWSTRVDLDTLITILAILRYKADTQQYPDTLSELVVKGYIEAVPDDPYSDGQIVYKQTDNGFLLYSQGADFDDDGGTPSNWGRGDKGGDQVFWPVEGTDEYIELQSKVQQ